MNKVCLIWSLGLLMTSTQQFCNRLDIQSLATQTQHANRAHETANVRYQNAVARYDEALARGASTQSLDELAKQKDCARAEYNQTKVAYEQAQKNEQKARDFALAQALQKQEDAKTAQHLQRQEYANTNQTHAYDAPPSYYEATKFTYEIASIKNAIDKIKRRSPEAAQQLAKEIYEPYNNCWWCK